MSSEHTLVSKDKALPGRSEPTVIGPKHAVLGNTTVPPFPANFETALFGMGCFWGVERFFYEQKGVYSTQVGYTGGYTPNPTLDEVYTGLTGHTEVVRVIYDPSQISYATLLKLFWENHDPTTLYRQRNDIGTQFRSAIYTYGAQQLEQAETTRDEFQAALTKAGFGQITTEIAPAGEFYYAADDQQQHLARNKEATCGVVATGVTL
uniref:Mitochondrial peptide methionine sulfoxide reductase n=1 Tax=Arion vulgaris TaxID=1028688 RepID=A0A0B6ZFH0_9EUPU